MDGPDFDKLARKLTNFASRRQALGGLLGAAAAVTGLGAAAEAKKNGGKGKDAKKGDGKGKGKDARKIFGKNRKPTLGKAQCSTGCVTTSTAPGGGVSTPAPVAQPLRPSENAAMPAIRRLRFIEMVIPVRRACSASQAGAPELPVKLTLAVVEYPFDRHLEQASQAERQGQRRVVLAGLDRVDRLARHVEPLRQLGLAPVALCAQNLEAVVHSTVPRIRVYR